MDQPISWAICDSSCGLHMWAKGSCLGPAFRSASHIGAQGSLSGPDFGSSLHTGAKGSLWGP
eukprot:11527653-Karenia_brevis.AAC.1